MGYSRIPNVGKLERVSEFKGFLELFLKELEEEGCGIP